MLAGRGGGAWGRGEKRSGESIDAQDSEARCKADGIELVIRYIKRRKNKTKCVKGSKKVMNRVRSEYSGNTN